MWNNGWVLLCFSLVTSVIAAGFKDFKVKVTKLECSHNDEICDELLCILKPINRHTSSVTLGCKIREPQPKILFEVTHMMKSSSNAYQPGMFHFQDDFCETSKGIKDSLITKIFNNIMDKMSNYYKQCTVQGDHYVENFIVDDDVIPPLFSTGNYRLIFREFLPGNITIYSVDVYFTVTNNKFSLGF